MMSKASLELLLKDVKKNKSDEYRSAYVDGVLDAYNEANREKGNTDVHGGNK